MLIEGGRSNLTYRVSGEAGGDVVVRRPPLGHVLPTAHDMAREYRVIAALHPTGFPVPVPLHLCDDPEVIGAPFYVMSYVDGRVLRDVVDLPPPVAARTGELLIDTLVALHAIEPEAVGLWDFGRPDGFLARQVRRWYGQWERSRTRDLPEMARLTDALAAAVPDSGRTGIVHGDYRLDNVIVDAAVSRVAAVLDWEMATLGDPLADLGLLVVYTELAADGLAPTQPRLGPERGFLPAGRLVERYLDHLGPGDAARPDDGIGWYVALGYYKLAVISEGINARHQQGLTVGEGFERIGRAVPALVERARAALADR
jgi:aminoglycoside phosphotransferase (APT) family kinase protein